MEITVREKLDKAIRRHRTADVTLTVRDRRGRPLADAPLVVQQTRHQFLFGCNAFSILGLDVPEQTAAYRKRFAELLNFATLPFYWRGYEKDEHKPQTRRLKAMAAWCASHGVRPKGHPLVWHNSQPEWIQDRSLAEFERLQMRRVVRDVRQFRGLVDTWDVINETEILPRFTLPLDRLPRLCHMIGRVEIIKRSFDAARAANPNATLILNDYETSPAYEEIIERCLDAGVGIDIIGIQSHMHTGYWGAEKTADVLRRFSRFRKPIHFTELTILSGKLKDINDTDWESRHENWTTTDDGELRQAEQAADFYRVLFAHPAVEAITWWDFCDQKSWMGASLGFLRADASPKPMYDELKKTIKGEWWTGPLKLRTDGDGRASFRAFLGTHIVKANGRRIEFAVDRPDTIEAAVRLT